MRDLSVEAEVVSATCFETSYKAFLSWRDFGCPGAPLYNMFGMAALQAADGPFMLGLMSEGTSAAGRLYFPAGTPEPFDIDARGRIDFEANVRRELQEETGLGTDDVVFGSDWTIVVDGSRVACMKPVQSTETAAELRRRLSVFNAMQSEPELADLIPIARQADYDARIPGFMIRYLDWALADQTL
jgi:8-oxo-dGTP pyrophosphatase MutT (NUDIX family)